MRLKHSFPAGFQTKGDATRAADLLHRPRRKIRNRFENMKTQTDAKSEHNADSPAARRAGGLRPNAAKAIEHRYERRKIREQLRRLDWALNAEGELFA